MLRATDELDAIRAECLEVSAPLSVATFRMLRVLAAKLDELEGRFSSPVSSRGDKSIPAELEEAA